MLVTHDVVDGVRYALEDTTREDETQLCEEFRLDALDGQVGYEGEEEDKQRGQRHEEREREGFGTLPQVAVREVLEYLHKGDAGTAWEDDAVGRWQDVEAPKAQQSLIPACYARCQ